MHFILILIGMLGHQTISMHYWCRTISSITWIWFRVHG